jgi:segregation and condensation protein B
MDKSKIKSVLESLLFVSGDPVKLAKLAKICQLGRKEIEEAIGDLDKIFQEQKRGIRIIKKDDSVQLASAPENADFVSQLVSGEMNADLSKSALETLSIVAYRGPITRAQIESIRGVNTSYVLRSLLLRGIIERKETSDIRGYIYEISFDFLKLVGIENTDSLPDWENLSKNEKVEELLAESDQEKN